MPQITMAQQQNAGSVGSAFGTEVAVLLTTTQVVTLAQAGAVTVSADGQFNTTGVLNLGSANASTVATSLDLTNGSATFGSLVVRTNTATANTITIGAGKTLTIAGAGTVGYSSGATTTTTLPPSTTTAPPPLSSPRRSRSANSSSIVFWITRRNGRAPKSGS